MSTWFLHFLVGRGPLNNHVDHYYASGEWGSLRMYAGLIKKEGSSGVLGPFIGLFNISLPAPFSSLVQGKQKTKKMRRSTN